MSQPRTKVAQWLGRLPPRVRQLVPAPQRTGLRHRLGGHHRWEEGVDLSPPTPGPGEVVGPPDFVGIGVGMAGAGPWYRMVVDHPGISARSDLPMARHLLAHYATRPFGPDQVARYHDWFPRRPGTVAGEWSPSYAALPWVPALLARAAPEARLLLMVRDPIERLRLGLARTEVGRGTQIEPSIAAEIDRGFYGEQLRRALEHFPVEQVLVLQYEQCVDDPAGRLAATYRFLGLGDTHRPAGLDRWAGKRPGLPSLDPDALDRLVGVYGEDVIELASLVPSLDLSRWPAFAGA